MRRGVARWMLKPVVAITLGFLVSTAWGNARAATPVEVRVRVATRGLNAVEAEAQAAIPIERAVSQVAGLTQMRSRASGDETQVRLTFASGTAAWTAASAVRASLSKVALPASLSPTVELLRDRVIYRFTVESQRQTSSELRALSDRLIRQDLLRLPGVAEVTTCGGEPRRVEVQVDAGRLQSLGLSPSEVSRALRDALLSARGASFGMPSVAVRSSLSIKDLEQLQIAQRAAAALRLRDVATIRIDARPPTCLAARDKRSSVLFAQVWLQRDADAQTVQAAIEAQLVKLRATLPADVTMQGFAFTPTPPVSTMGKWLKRLRSPADSTPSLLHVQLRHSGEPQPAAVQSLSTALRELAGQLPAVESVLTQAHLIEDPQTESAAGDLDLFLALRGGQTRASLATWIDTLLIGLAKLPGASDFAVRAEDPLGLWPAEQPPRPVGLRSCGPDLEQLAQLADRLRASLSGVPAIRALRIDGARQRPQLRVGLDRNAMAQLGIAAPQVISLLAASVEGENVGALINGEERLDVIVRTASGADLQTAFKTATIKNCDGAAIPLSMLATLTSESVPITILREQGQRCVRITMTAPSLNTQQLIQQTQDRVRSLQLPLGVSVSWDPPLAD